MVLHKTVIYYTSNQERPEFEKKITDRISAVKGNIPVVSVSQKPMDFGLNICVGDVGQSYVNAFHQCLIGCEVATTPFVVMAESDCLYPETGYFDFEPTDEDAFYSYDNVWILNKRWNHFYRKNQTHGSMIYGRKSLIKYLKNVLAKLPEWSREKIDFPFYDKDQEFVHFSGFPIINIITGANGRKGTVAESGGRETLPYWGTIKEVKAEMLL